MMTGRGGAAVGVDREPPSAVAKLARVQLPALQPGETILLEGLPTAQPARRIAYLQVAGIAYHLFGAGRCRVKAPLAQKYVVVERLSDSLAIAR